MTIPGRLFEHALQDGDRIAFRVIADGEVTTLSYETLARQAAAYADWYAAAGVRPGQVVVLCLRHSPTMYAAFLGAMLAGAIPSFIPFPTLKQDPVLYWEAHRVLFARVEAGAVITYADNAPDLAEILPPGTPLLIDTPERVRPRLEPMADLVDSYPLPDPDGVALLQHSSGTTGHKKGVMLTHRQIDLQVAAYTEALGVDETHCVASWLPIYHDMGLISAFIGPVIVGASVVSIDAFEWVERPHLLLELMDKYQCDAAWLPNFAYNHLIRTKQGDETYQLGHVTAFLVASEPCKAELVDRFVEVFASHGIRPEQITTAYGLAETVMMVSTYGTGRAVPRTYFDTVALRHGRAISRTPGPGAIGYLSNGPLLRNIEARVDPAAEGPGEGVAIGELQYRGPYVFDGYFRNPEASAAAFDDGWARSGDLGCLIDGQVYVLGRTKDVIIHHGVNYYTHDLEAVASGVSGVKPGRCAALAVYDEQTGSERVEFVAERDPDNPVEDVDLRRAVKYAIHDRYQVTVARVHLVDDGWLIKTTSGKVSRIDNLTKLEQHPPLVGLDTGEWDGDVAPAPQDLEHVVLRTIATTFNVSLAELSRATTALDVPGWDSLGHTVLMIRLSKALDLDIPEDVAALAADVGELVDLLDRVGEPA